MLVLLDSNFLLLPFQYRIDIFAEIEALLNTRPRYAVPEQVLRELEQLSSRGGKLGKFARSAIALAEQRCSVVSVDAENADEALEKLAERGTIICTNDKVLKEKVRKRGSAVIFLRERQKLAVAGYIH
ncbi:MAG: twitching motility protein PilT [Euryarchaeota archaeon]|nr:twitching motility protein PilT [Euryarchaeota archaeon]